MDAFALHLTVPDEIARCGQCRQTRTNDIGRFIIDTLRLAGMCKGFVVATGIIHNADLLNFGCFRAAFPLALSLCLVYPTTYDRTTYKNRTVYKIYAKDNFCRKSERSVSVRIDFSNRFHLLILELPEDYWDFKADDTHEYTHGLHNYPAMMVSPISRNLIRITSSIRPVHSLFDPFSGSGTVLVEGMLAGIPTVCGNDINPLALLLCRVKTTPLDPIHLRKVCSALLDQIHTLYQRDESFFSGADHYMREVLGLDLTAKDNWGSDAPNYLKEYCLSCRRADFEIPSFKNIGYWFKPNVILSLQLIKNCILEISDEPIRNFVFVAFSESIRLVSNRRNGEFKMFRMPPKKVAAFSPSVIGEFSKILSRNIEKMGNFYAACSNTSRVTIHRDNATELKSIPDDMFDLVITSPPYGDSRTTVAYGEYSRLSLQWLGLGHLTEKEILGIDRSLMGGKKYRKGFASHLHSPTLQNSLEQISAIDLERAGDVYSFYEDLDASIRAVSEKTKAGGYQFWVVGNRTVKKVLLQTDVIISELASLYHLQHVYTIDRNIPNKVMPSLNSPTNEAGAKVTTMTNEHIVVLRKI